MLKKSILIMGTVALCTLEVNASLVAQLGSIKTLLTGSVVPTGILGAASIGFFASLIKGNVPQAFSIVGVGVLFAFFYAWVIAGFDLGIAA